MSLMATMTALLATITLFAWGVAMWVLRRAEALRLVQEPNDRSSHDGIDGIAGTQAVFMLLAGAVLMGVGRTRGKAQSQLDVDAVRRSGNGGVFAAQLASSQNLYGRCEQHVVGVHGVRAGTAFHSSRLVESRSLAGAGGCFSDRCNRHAAHPQAARGALVRGASQPCLPTFILPVAGRPQDERSLGNSSRAVISAVSVKPSCLSWWPSWGSM